MANSRLVNLVNENPFCYWCGRRVLYFALEDHMTVPEDYATIDHLNDRIDYTARPSFNRKVTTVLAHRKCNGDRARDKMKKLSKERRQWLQLPRNERAQTQIPD